MLGTQEEALKKAKTKLEKRDQRGKKAQLKPEAVPRVKSRTPSKLYDRGVIQQFIIYIVQVHMGVI